MSDWTNACVTADTSWLELQGLIEEYAELAIDDARAQVEAFDCTEAERASALTLVESRIRAQTRDAFISSWSRLQCERAAVQ
jgi:hypothetical protein